MTFSTIQVKLARGRAVAEFRRVIPGQVITGTFASPGCVSLWIAASADAVKITRIGRVRA